MFHTLTSQDDRDPRRPKARWSAPDDRRAHLRSSPSCHEAVGPDRLVAYDVASGTVVDLAGSPHADDGTYLGGPVSWVAGR